MKLVFNRRLALVLAVAVVAVAGVLGATASAAGGFTFTANASSGVFGSTITVQSTTPCPNGTQVFVTLQTPDLTPVSGFNELIPVNADGSWAGTVKTLAGSVPTGDYLLAPHCQSIDGLISYDPIPFSYVPETFTADQSSGVFGTPIALHSTAPCPNGTQVFVTLQTPDLIPVSGFNELIPVNADGSWAGTVKNLAGSVSTGDYLLAPHCQSVDGLISYDPIPFTYVPETFAADKSSGPVGTTITLHSTAPCLNGSEVFVILQTPAGTPVSGFNEFIFVNPDGSWSGAVTNLAQPIPPGSYFLAPECQSNDGLVNYDRIPFTYTAADSAAPSMTISSGVPDGQNGWFVTGPINGTVSADDSASGGSNIASIDCGALALSTSGIGTPHATGSFSIAAQGVTHISCTASDSAGNTSAAATKDVKLDSFAPSLAPSISPATVVLHGSALASANATDQTSGVASQSCGAVDTSSAGLHTVGCTATDNAGNVGTASLGYLVGYQILGFFSPAPKSKWKAGQTVPIKLALADVNGNRISDAEAQGLLSPTCRVTFAATGVQGANGCMKYDTGDHQFVFNWKLGQATGAVTIAVTVAYPGTASTTVLSTSITVSS